MRPSRATTSWCTSSASSRRYPPVAGAELEIRSLGTFDGPMWDAAARRMSAADADAYIAVDSAYRLTPDRDQLVVTVLMRSTGFCNLCAVPLNADRS